MLTEERKLTLLVVDDEVALRELYVACVEDFEVKIVEACDGMDALAKCDAEKIDCVITDIMMPRMDGMQLLKELRERNFFKPVVIASAFADKDKCIQALQLGAFDLLDKPFKVTRLKATIAEALKVSRSMNRLQEELSAVMLKAGYPLPQDLDKAVSSILMMKALRFPSAS